MSSIRSQFTGTKVLFKEMKAIYVRIYIYYIYSYQHGLGDSIKRLPNDIASLNVMISYMYSHPYEESVCVLVSTYTCT